MTLDEQIKQAEETADRFYKEMNGDHSEKVADQYGKIAAEQKQLVQWLKHYKEIRNIIDKWSSDYFAEKSRSDYFLMIVDTFDKQGE